MKQVPWVRSQTATHGSLAAVELLLLQRSLVFSQLLLPTYLFVLCIIVWTTGQGYNHQEIGRKVSQIQAVLARRCAAVGELQQHLLGAGWHRGVAQWGGKTTASYIYLHLIPSSLTAYTILDSSRSGWTVGTCRWIRWHNVCCTSRFKRKWQYPRNVLAGNIKSQISDRFLLHATTDIR